MNLKDKTLWQRNAAAIGGMVLFAAGINFFIVPASLYNGGVLGISQIIRTLLIQVFPSLASGTDIAGIINFILNIPLFIMAYISIGKSFFSRTLVCLISQTIFLSIFPIPATPLVNDSLTASIMGGLLAGTGIGISLRSGGSSGGMDIVGMFFTKKYKNFSVGKVSLTVNAVVYGICAILFGIPTAVYSIIYSAVSTLMTDKAHTQNINTVINTLLYKVIHQLVGIMPIAQHILPAEEHLQLCIGALFADQAQSVPGILIQKAQAGVKSGTAPALQRMITDLVHLL